jgi:hypothetical protein
LCKNDRFCSKAQQAQSPSWLKSSQEQEKQSEKSAREPVR